MSTEKRLVEAASRLLDEGGEIAVTLRAVSQAVGVSHNTPYRHFKNRNALLAAVAADDFEQISISMGRIRASDSAPRDKLMSAFNVLIDYGRERRSRYKLLFDNPALTAESPKLEHVGEQGISELFAIVEECQQAGILPDTDRTPLAGLMLATLHGLLALEANGPLPRQKGLTTVAAGMGLMVDLLSNSGGTGPKHGSLT